MSAYESISSVLVERFKVDGAAVTPQTTLEELEFDSLFIVEFLLVLEEQLKVSIPDTEVTPSHTVEAVAAMAEEQLTEQTGAS